MGKRLVVLVGLLGFLASSQVASACEKCKLAGFVCNIDECFEVWTCSESHFGSGGGGQNDCELDLYGNCNLSGGFCQWAAKTSPLEKDQVFAPICHETKS